MDDLSLLLFYPVVLKLQIFLKSAKSATADGA
jgi:hypothetical protein